MHPRLLLLPLLLIAVPAAAAPPPKREPARLVVSPRLLACQPAIERVGGSQAARVRPLGELPPAAKTLTVVRQVDGCPVDDIAWRRLQTR